MKKPQLKPKPYPLLCRAVEEGVAYGLMRAHKHTDNPSEDHVKATVEQAVIDAICDAFDLD